MSASEFAGLTAVVAGGASGIGPATARLTAARGARVACVGLKPDDMPAPLVGIPADVADVAVTASRWADWSPSTRSPPPSRTLRARSPVPPPVLISLSTAACTG